jgi:type III pantothenate kinase
MALREENHLFLALDVGNTHTVVGLFSETNQLIKTWRVSTHPVGTGDEFRMKLEFFLCHFEMTLGDLSSIVASSAVPSFTRILKEAFRPQMDREALHIIDSSWPFSFRIKPSPAAQVGSNQLVNAEAALREYGSPCILIDAGTVTTLCAIKRGKDGARPDYLGGAVLPGIELSMEALARQTSQLARVDFTPPPHAIGRNPNEALRSGVVLGYVSMIEGMITRFKMELETHRRAPLNEAARAHVPTPIIATGSMGHLIKRLVSEITDYDAELTLKGIAYLYGARSSQQFLETCRPAKLPQESSLLF